MSAPLQWPGCAEGVCHSTAPSTAEDPPDGDPVPSHPQAMCKEEILLALPRHRGHM